VHSGAGAAGAGIGGTLLAAVPCIAAAYALRRTGMQYDWHGKTDRYARRGAKSVGKKLHL